MHATSLYIHVDKDGYRTFEQTDCWGRIEWYQLDKGWVAYRAGDPEPFYETWSQEIPGWPELRSAEDLYKFLFVA